MAASGLIVAYLPGGEQTCLVVRDGIVVDANRRLRPRIVGASAHKSWLELCGQASEMWWLPLDRGQEPVRHVPKRAKIRGAVLDRLRRSGVRRAVA